MEPVVMALEKKYEDDVVFIDADLTNGSNPRNNSDIQAAELAQKYNITSIPAIFLIDSKGNVVEQFVGAQSYDLLAQKIEKLK